MRSRNIKPGFFENESLSELDPLARILFAGLWCYCDKEGRFEWRPKRIKALILPYDNCDIEKLLMSLHAATFICMYLHENEKYGCIPNFKRHQNPHPHEAKSRLPTPPEKPEQFQCHGMSVTLNEMSVKSHAESLNPESLNPESIKISLSPDKPADLPPQERIPYQEILDAFNKFCPSLSTALQLTEPRKRAIRLRWLEHKKIDGGPIAFFDALFKKTESSDFITGRNGSWPGKRGVDWVLEPRNIVKIMEGNYDNGNENFRDRGSAKETGRKAGFVEANGPGTDFLS